MHTVGAIMCKPNNVVFIWDYQPPTPKVWPNGGWYVIEEETRGQGNSAMTSAAPTTQTEHYAACPMRAIGQGSI
jgi:hypothetical protein